MEKSAIIGKSIEPVGKITISCDKSQRILVCGKTGTGKSYTLGVLIEELSNFGEDIVLAVDPQGIFWTMAEPNQVTEATDKLQEYNLLPKGFRVNLLVPGDPLERYGSSDIISELARRGLFVQGLRLNPSDLSPEMWCDLFNLDINELQGIMLFKAVRLCKKKLKNNFLIPNIADQIIKLDGLDKTKEALLRKLEMAEDWQIFEEHQYREIWEILQPNAINILDLSVIAQGRYGLRNLVVAVLANFIFEKRTIARRREELGLATDMRKVWLFIDEAHNFCPSGKSTLSKEIIIRWAKEGRQPGLSLVVASQQPSAIDSEVLTQCGIRIIHRITSKEDYKAVNALSQDFLDDSLVSRIKNLTGPGQTIMIDDEKETAVQVLVRLRQSNHGGGSA
ncbi:putative ATPase [Desulfitobacterium dehalogenans ATCC 51507]|uniref:Putative ATPase n=1 Tax=Desulfitobacterium dehalogenans (strain ATCC 51507 / DSM 9161 / JW/IU-DC1) TaxID=756499 RepID=I4A817_DESDJ|nr:ATP-binding protein [Desulfitobacterium dehalogenans]AFM00102.1 putative ATPase [Desulfitobacterium dehalogenans ATCC 51507]